MLSISVTNTTTAHETCRLTTSYALQLINSITIKNPCQFCLLSSINSQPKKKPVLSEWNSQNTWYSVLLFITEGILTACYHYSHTKLLLALDQNGMQ